MNIDIRPISPEEVSAIAALARTVWLDAYSGILTRAQIDYMLAQRYSAAQLETDIAAPNKWLYQAFLDGFRAGYAACELCEGKGKGKAEFKLDKLYVHPAMQRRGIGAALVEHAATLARAEGFSAMILAVNKKNEQAIRAYTGYGFNVRDKTVTDIGNGFIMDDFIMEKKL
ncbi:MAG: GNAT family N-acetyltransferase [Azoarcus sp.]|jgi:ribosomal protein S18 acetylase RimI-like enzyme|nr:GNAT family N-acetyltransferase [Azoarcus sp.]